MLGKESPLKLATRVVNGTQLRDPAVRKQLFEGGKLAVAASKDPMIQLAVLVDPDARAIRKHYEENIEAVVRKNSELVAKAKFELYGTGIYPDATFSLRLSYGSVKGYMEDGKPVAPFTTMAGAYERHTGEEPFALPRTLAGRQGQAEALHPDELRQHQRHHRRQLRLARHQQGRGDRRPGVRRQHPVARR